MGRPLREIIESVAERFARAGLVFGHGFDSAWDEAVALVLYVTGLPDERSVLEHEIDEDRLERIESLAGRRIAERIPLAYLLGRCRFAGREFLIVPGVVVPRSPIGALIRRRFAPWLRRDPLRILDLCCGSGCIGIAAALAFAEATVDLVDDDADAVTLSRRNVTLHGLESRARVFQSDLFDSVPGGPWDLIVSNPPYVDRRDLASLPAEYRHEPEHGLAGGRDGLDLVARVLTELPRRLAPGGTFVCEVGASAPALLERFPAIPFLWPDLPDGGEGVFILQPVGAARRRHTLDGHSSRSPSGSGRERRSRGRARLARPPPQPVNPGRQPHEGTNGLLLASFGTCSHTCAIANRGGSLAVRGGPPSSSHRTLHVEPTGRMAGNSFGQLFRVTTFGESHGPALGAVVDGCPPGLALSEDDLQRDLDRRRPGQSRYTTQRDEPDRVRILSGVFEGLTTGTSIGLVIDNVDQKSKDYSNIKDIYRPSHADFTYQKKYGIRDYRGGGRASARETAMRVAAAGIAKKYLGGQCGTMIRGYLSAIGPLRFVPRDLDVVDANAFFCPEPERVDDIAAFIDRLRREGDSIGAEVTVVATGVPVGLGEPVFGKLDAELAGALMSINAVKGVGIGDGFAVVEQRGTTHRDEMTASGFSSNRSGGVLGGISTGQDLIARIALKPTSSLTTPGHSVDVHGNEVEVVTKGRHDPCVGIRAVPIAEAMVALVLMDHLMRHRAQVPSQAGDGANAR